MKKFIFDVPCYYVYEVEAKTEKEARKILIKDGGLDRRVCISLFVYLYIVDMMWKAFALIPVAF